MIDKWLYEFKLIWGDMTFKAKAVTIGLIVICLIFL